MPIQHRFNLHDLDRLKQFRFIFRLTLALAVVSVLVFMFASGKGQVTAQVTPSRIAVVDLQKVLTQSVAGKAAYARLKKLQDDRVAKARLMDQEMRNLELNMKVPTLSTAQRRDLSSQISDKRLAMQRFAQDSDKELGDARTRELSTLGDKIKPTIDALGKEMGLAAIFNKFESGLVFSVDSIDITNAVIVRFNSVTPAQPAARP